MNDNRRSLLDDLFNAFSIISESSYIFVCDMKEDLSRWSQSAVDYFGLPGEYMYAAGGIWEEHIHEEDREAYHTSIEDIFSGKNGGHDMQYRARARDGGYVVCTCRGVVIKDNNGNPEIFAGSIFNHGLQSNIDSVTGLRNQYGFFEDLQSLLWKKDKALIMLVGISAFSDINEVYGYSFGNRVLQRVGRTIQKLFSNSGAIYRKDGAKFAIISHTLSEKEIAALYDELHEQVKNDFNVDGIPVNLFLNAGMLNVDSFDVSYETLYSCLGYAYNESKNMKMGDLAVFEDELSDGNRRKVERLNVIRNSIINGCKGFFLCYQPIVDAETERLVGIEALVRWKNDIYGTVPPNEFISVLETDPAFAELGNWILRQAMTDGLKFIERYPDVVMNVNLSYTQLEKSEFLNDVNNLLDETGFPAKNLCLEITERCRLLDLELLKHIIKELSGRGVQFALDDFGMGFSSLNILKMLPVDVVKIDREFVKDIVDNEQDERTIRHVAELASVYGSKVCVEGIETCEMRDYVRRCPVNSFQGYLYSRPITYDEFMQKGFK